MEATSDHDEIFTKRENGQKNWELEIIPPKEQRAQDTRAEDGRAEEQDSVLRT